MQRYAAKSIALRRYKKRRCRTWHYFCRKDRPATYGAYPPLVAVSRDVARVNFARFIQRALRAARDRGMNDRAIETKTGVGASTFHRWQRGDWTRTPTADKVRDFCVGLGASFDDAAAALGWTGATTVPEPPMDPDVEPILRRLADPHVPEAEKAAIRSVLQLLARRPPGTSAAGGRTTG